LAYTNHFLDCKALLVASLTHISGAITSVQTFSFTITFTFKAGKILTVVDSTKACTLMIEFISTIAEDDLPSYQRMTSDQVLVEFLQLSDVYLFATNCLIDAGLQRT